MRLICRHRPGICTANAPNASKHILHLGQGKGVRDSAATRLEYMMIDYTFAVACMMFFITYLHCGPPLGKHAKLLHSSCIY